MRHYFKYTKKIIVLMGIFSSSFVFAGAYDDFFSAIKRDDASLLQSLPGVDLLDEKQVASRSSVFGEIYEHDVYDIARPAASLRYRWVVSGEWKLIVPHAERVPDGVTELFHLSEDPDEMRNLAESEPDRVATLRKLLEAHWRPE